MRLTSIRALVLAVLAIAIGLSPAGALSAPVNDRKDRVDQRLERAEARLRTARDRESVLTADVSSLTAQVRAVESRLAPLTRRRDVLVARQRVAVRRLGHINRQLSFQRTQLNIASGRLVLQRAVLAERLREIYRTGDRDPILVLFESGSLADVVGTASGIERATDRDRGMIGEVSRYAGRTRIAAGRIAVLQARVSTEERRATALAGDARRAARDLDVEHRVLVRTRRVRSRLLGSIRVDRGYIEKDTAALRKQSFALARRIAEIQGVPFAEPSDTTPSAAGFVWPTSGTVTSGFGPRWGRIHQGLDIAAPTGTPITAAASGTVIVAGSQGGYGNLVVIDHGGGLATAYAHQSRLAVQEGDSVTQGGLVGYVGSTGHSTGPHLHFEVRVNGAARDPVPYL